MDLNPSRRRWYQFSLRTIFVVAIFVSIPLAWVLDAALGAKKKYADVQSLMQATDQYYHEE